MYMCHVHAWYLWTLEEDLGSPGTGVTDGYEPLCGSWELNLGSLNEQPMLLTPETFFQPPLLTFEDTM